MATTVESVIVSLEAKMDKYNRDISSAAATTDKKLGLISASATKMQRTTSAAFSGARAAAAGFVASVGIDAITRAIKSGLDYASSLGEVSQQLGVTTDDLQFYRFVATQTGISQEEMDAGLQKLTKTLGEAAQGGKAQAAAFEAVGVNIRDANGHLRSAGEILPDIAQGIAGLNSVTLQGAASTDLFGKAGQKLLPALQGGSRGINELAAAYAKLNIALTPEQIKNADDAADKLSALKQVLEARIAQTVANNSKEIVKLANDLFDLADQAVKTLKDYNALTNALGKPIPYKNQNILQRLASDLNEIQDYGSTVNRFFGGDGRGSGAPPLRNLTGVNKPTTSQDFTGKPAIPSSLRAPAGPMGSKAVNASAFGLGGAAALAGLDFNEVIAQLAKAAPLVEQFTAATGRARIAEIALTAEAKALVENLIQSNRVAVLRAEGRSQEADDIEAIARVTQDVNTIEGLTATQRAQLLATARQLTIEGLRQVENAAKMLDIEIRYQDELSQRVGDSSEAIMNGITKSVNDELDDYTERGKRAQEDLADTFENLFSNGVGSVWQQFKREGIRAISQVLAELIIPNGTGGGGGGLLTGLVNAVGRIFGGGGVSGGGTKDTGNLLGRASGGLVSAGNLYRVNESGTEGFRPAQSGNIIPLGQMPNAITPGRGEDRGEIRIALQLSDELDARILSVSIPASVQISRIHAEQGVKEAVSEVTRQFNRPRL